MNSRHLLRRITFSFDASLQFETDYVVQSTLQIGDELFNTKYKDKLEPSYKVEAWFSLQSMDLFFFFWNINGLVLLQWKRNESIDITLAQTKWDTVF